MSRISLAEAQSLPDILSGENFRMNLGEIPGFGDTTPLSIKCQTAVIPGRQNEVFEVSLGAFIRNFSGRNRFPGTLTITYVEDITVDTLTALHTWLEQIRGTESGTSIGNVSDYAVSAELEVFDQAGNTVETITFRNLFIVDVQDSSLEVSGSQPIQVQATFRYDVINRQTVSTR